MTKRTVLAGMIALTGVAVCASAEENPLSGVDTWGYRKALPAVVNPAVRSSLQSVVSLRGEWEFVAQPTNVRPRRHPGWDRFFNRPWPDARTIQVPGCWEAQAWANPAWATRGTASGILRQAAAQHLRRRRMVSQNGRDSRRLAGEPDLAQGRRRTLAGLVLGQPRLSAGGQLLRHLQV